MTLSIKNDEKCSGSRVLIDIPEDHSHGCTTRDKGSFGKGSTLIWTKDEDNELEQCANMDFDPLNDEIFFKIRSNSGDDFCPKRLTLTMSDSQEYKSDVINDFVSKSKGNKERIAKKTTTIGKFD